MVSDNEWTRRNRSPILAMELPSGIQLYPLHLLVILSSMMLLRKIVGYYETQQSTEGKRWNRKKAAAYLILVNKVAARILAFVVSYVAFFVSSSWHHVCVHQSEESDHCAKASFRPSTTLLSILPNLRHQWVGCNLSILCSWKVLLHGCSRFHDECNPSLLGAHPRRETRAFPIPTHSRLPFPSFRICSRNASIRCLSYLITFSPK